MEPGRRRTATVIYLQRPPGRWFEHRPPCLFDDCKGFLVAEADARGFGDMWVCVGGCGQRFFEEFD